MFEGDPSAGLVYRHGQQERARSGRVGHPADRSKKGAEAGWSVARCVPGSAAARVPGVVQSFGAGSCFSSLEAGPRPVGPRSPVCPGSAGVPGLFSGVRGRGREFMGFCAVLPPQAVSGAVGGGVSVLPSIGGAGSSSVSGVLWCGVAASRVLGLRVAGARCGQGLPKWDFLGAFWRCGGSGRPRARHGSSPPAAPVAGCCRRGVRHGVSEWGGHEDAGSVGDPRCGVR